MKPWSSASRRMMRTLRIGVDAAPPVPMNFGVPGSADFRGFEVDLMNAISEKMGWKLEFKSLLWSELLGELSEGSLDIVCGAATITEERRDLFEFSDPYLDIELVVVARSDDPITSVTPSSIFGVRVATEAEKYLKWRWPKNPAILFDFNTEAYHALQADAVDRVIDDSPIAMHFASALQGLKVSAALPDTGARYGLMMRKGNGTLQASINTVLRNLRADGTMEALYLEWFPRGTKLS